MANITDIAQIIGVISAAYPNFNATELTVEVYYQTLSDIPTDELKHAVLHCISENGRKFAPSVGEIRGAVAELRGYTTNMPTSFQAWQEVLQQIGAVGSYGKPSFSHPLVERAVKAMGWRDLCLSENTIADRARFIQCYEQLQEREQRTDMLLPEVRGYIEVNGAVLPAPMESIKLLSSKLSK